MKCELLPSRNVPYATHQLLRERLDHFYSSAQQYTAFVTPSDHSICWVHIAEEIQKKLQGNSLSRLKVLEIGAGRTGFARYLMQKGLRQHVDFHVQDVTQFNEVWLKGEADSVFFGDVLDCSFIDHYDFIFSTYVLEHVTNPHAHLDRLWSLLASQGNIFIFSPRYDMPGYICPSARHLCKIKQFQFGLQAIVARLFSWITRQPQFLIQNDLAAFYLPFYSDSDAVHWVFLQDIEAWAAHRKASLKRLKLGQPAFPSKDWLIKRFCTLAVQISVNSHAS
jgi:2-polyprenyl-3-methyl-5-hydroxy-6-metoxy-1,4-benzoquinol methylase